MLPLNFYQKYTAQDRVFYRLMKHHNSLVKAQYQSLHLTAFKSWIFGGNRLEDGVYVIEIGSNETKSGNPILLDLECVESFL